MYRKPKDWDDFVSNHWFHMLVELSTIKDKVATNTKLTYLILGAIIAGAIGQLVF